MAVHPAPDARPDVRPDARPDARLQAAKLQEAKQAEAAKQQARLEGFADEFSAILSRQIDERIAA